MTCEELTTGLYRIYPSAGMHLYDEQNDTVVDGEVYCADVTMLDSWREITAEEAAEIRERQGLAADANFAIPDSYKPTDADSIGSMKKKMNNLIGYLNSKLAAVLVALMPIVAFGAVAPSYTTLNDLPGTARVMTNVAEYVDGGLMNLGADVTNLVVSATNAADIVRGEKDADGVWMIQVSKAHSANYAAGAEQAGHADNASHANHASHANYADNASSVPWGGVTGKPDIVTSNEVAGLYSAVASLWTYTYGNRVWIAVTNYMRTVEGVAPTMQLWEVREDQTNLVYSTAEEIDTAIGKHAETMRTELTNGLNAVRGEIPTSAWSAYQSRSGEANPAPSDTTVISTPSVLLTGGAEWQQYIDASRNSLWVLTTSGAAAMNTDTDGAFRILDAEGKVALELSKRAAMLVPAQAQTVVPPNGGAMEVTFIATACPVLYTSGSLRSADFKQQGSDPNCSVSWRNNNNGTWTAVVDFVTPQPQYFCYANFEIPGETIIRHKAPMAVDGGILCTDGVTRVRPKVENGVVSWEVIP